MTTHAGGNAWHTPKASYHANYDQVGLILLCQLSMAAGIVRLMVFLGIG
jgi:hypothetical protein